MSDVNNAVNTVNNEDDILAGLGLGDDTESVTSAPLAQPIVGTTGTVSGAIFTGVLEELPTTQRGAEYAEDFAELAARPAPAKGYNYFGVPLPEDEKAAAALVRKVQSAVTRENKVYKDRFVFSSRKQVNAILVVVQAVAKTYAEEQAERDAIRASAHGSELARD